MIFKIFTKERKIFEKVKIIFKSTENNRKEAKIEQDFTAGSAYV